MLTSDYDYDLPRELIAQHPDAVLPQVLNYTQMTATFYFLEVSRLLEIPMYNE